MSQLKNIVHSAGVIQVGIKMVNNWIEKNKQTAYMNLSPQICPS